MNKSIKNVIIGNLFLEIVNAHNNDFNDNNKDDIVKFLIRNIDIYFLCTRTFDNNLQMSKQQCPLGILFNKDVMRCV